MFYNFKDYLNDPKKLMERNFNYSYDDYYGFNKILKKSFEFINNDCDFDSFIEDELKEVIGKEILFGGSFIEVTKQKLKECIIKSSLTCDFEVVMKNIKRWSNGYELYYIIPVCGISLSPIDILDNVSLITLDELSCCRLKMNTIKNIKESKDVAECFLKIRIGKYRLVNKDDINTLDHERNRYYADFKKVTDTLQYIVPLLPVITGVGCIPYYESIFFIDGFYYDEYSIIDTPDFLRRLQNINYRSIQIVSEKDINVDIVKKYLQFPDNIKKDLIPAFEYYNKYLLCFQNQYADAAIFLRIALESLLIDGYGNKKFQVSHRSAYLLNSSIKEVNKCTDNYFKINVYRFSALYSMTSTFIHGDESYDSNSIGLGYQSISQGYLESLRLSIQEIFINYINLLSSQLSNIENKKYYNDIIFKESIKKIKENSSCKQNKCIESKEYIQKFIDELFCYEKFDKYSRDRYMLFKLLLDRVEEKIYDYNSGADNGKLGFKDLKYKPINFDKLRDSSKRFITGILSNYYSEIGEGNNVPSWIKSYIAGPSDKWINLNDESIPPTFDTSNVDKYYAIRKLLPTAIRISLDAR